MLCLSSRNFWWSPPLSQLHPALEMGRAIPILRANHPLLAVALAFNALMSFAPGNHAAHNIANRPAAVRTSLFRAMNMVSRRVAKRKMSLLRILFQAAEGTYPHRRFQTGEHWKRLGEWYGLAKQGHFSFRCEFLIGLSRLRRELNSHRRHYTSEYGLVNWGVHPIKAGSFAMECCGPKYYEFDSPLSTGRSPGSHTCGNGFCTTAASGKESQLEVKPASKNVPVEFIVEFEDHRNHGIGE